MRCGISRRRFVRSAVAGAGALAASVGMPVAGQAGAEWGDLIGRFVYDGRAPQRRKLTVDKDIDCCGKFDIRDESLMVAADGGLANVFVYARSRELAIAPDLASSVPKQVKLDNRDCIFQPHCLTLWHTKQELHIVNSDPIAQHVVFRPLGDAAANIILSAAPGHNVDVVWEFKKTQVTPVPIACNYHVWESAYVLPRDNPYATVSAGDGTFRISKLPVGKIEFQCWHECTGCLDTPQWKRGRFEWEIKSGTNDVGTIRLAPATFQTTSRPL